MSGIKRIYSPSSDTESGHQKRLDHKTSPVKMANVNESDELEMVDLERRSNEVLEAISSDAPNWFCTAFEFISGELRSLAGKNTGSVAELKKQQDENVGEISKLNSRVDSLELKNEELITEIAGQNEQILKLDTYGRKENLLFDGIPDGPNQDVAKTLLNVITNNLQIQNMKIKFSKVHRLGKPFHTSVSSTTKPRTIIAKFIYSSDRDQVWAAKSKLKGSNIIISEDFPPTIRERRKKLLPFFLAARHHQRVKKVVMQYDKLVVNGSEYSVDNTGDLPFGLNQADKSERYLSNSDTTVFFGYKSILSNFHPGSFEENSLKFSTSEHYYQFQKCVRFSDDITGRKILKAATPGQAKALSYQIADFNEKDWLTVAKTTMFRACYLKFSQNEHLKEKLMEITGDMVEANPKDTFFSCGLHLNNPDVSESSKWTGQNVLGDVLGSVRARLIQEH